MWGSNRLFFILLILSSFSHLICLDYSSRNPGARLTLDSGEYLWAAHNLRNGTVLYAGDLSEPRIPALYSRRPPLYPSLIALALSCWDDLRAVILVQVILSLISGYLLWHLLGSVGVFGRIRLASVATCLFYPAQMIYTQTIMPGVLLQTFVLVSVFCLVLFLKTGNSRYLWIMNASLSLALLTKPILMLFWLPNLAFHVWVGVKNRRLVLVFAALLPLLVQSLWSYRNYRHTGSFHFSSMSTQIQGYLTKRYEAKSEQIENLADPRQGGSGEEWSAGSQRREQPFYKVAMEYPLDLARRQLRGMVAFFLDPGRFDFYQFFSSPYAGRGFSKSMDEWEAIWQTAWRTGSLLKYLIAIGLFNLLITAAFVLFPFQPLRAELKVFVFLVVIYMAVMTAGYGRSRYRLAVMPELFLAAAVVLDRHRREFRRGEESTADALQV